MMHLFLDRNKRPMSHLIKKPTLQLDNHQYYQLKLSLTHSVMQEVNKRIISFTKGKDLMSPVDKRS